MADSVVLDTEDVEEVEEQEVDEVEDLEADEEIDDEWRASDKKEIEELGKEVDENIPFFVRTGDLELGQSAMTKVCSELIGILRMNWQCQDDKASKADLP